MGGENLAARPLPAKEAEAICGHVKSVWERHIWMADQHAELLHRNEKSYLAVIKRLPGKANDHEALLADIRQFYEISLEFARGTASSKSETQK